MRSRWKLAPPAAMARGHAGNHRLHARWETFIARKKRPVVANVAVARELAGWCWSLAVLETERSAHIIQVNTHKPPVVTAGGSAWTDPRNSYEQPSPVTLDTRAAVPSSRTARPAVTNPRISA